MSTARIPGARVTPRKESGRSIPNMDDFTVGILTYRDMRNITVPEERDFVRAALANSIDAVSSKIKCHTIHDINNLIPGDSLETGGIGLTQNEIDALKNDPALCDTSEFNGDIEKLIFGIYEDGNPIGAWSMNVIKIVSETGTLLEISAAPISGFGYFGEAHWGKLHSLEWISFTTSLMKFFLDTSFLLSDGKTLQLTMWDVPLRSREEFLKRADVIAARGGKDESQPIIDEVEGIKSNQETRSGKEWLVYKKETI